jgi:hypothetical protein
MKLIVAAVLLSFSFGPAFSLDNSIKTGGWSKCKLDCDNNGGGPVVVRECKKRCDEGLPPITLKNTNGKVKTIDPNAPVLTPDN